MPISEGSSVKLVEEKNETRNNTEKQLELLFAWADNVEKKNENHVREVDDLRAEQSKMEKEDLISRIAKQLTKRG
jgi:hypothetical protein